MVVLIYIYIYIYIPNSACPNSHVFCRCYVIIRLLNANTLPCIVACDDL